MQAAKTQQVVIYKAYWVEWEYFASGFTEIADFASNGSERYLG